jgi:hypothetical protein
MRKNILGLAFVGLLALSNTGCIKKMIMDSQIKATRIGSGAADTIADYEVIRSAAAAGVLQFEGMHRLAPDNEDGLFMLLRGWAGWGYGFALDDYEVATLAGDDAAAEYHKKRTKMAYDRAIAYGLELIGHRDENFTKAKKNADTLNKWLKENFDEEEDAETLFWLGSAWIARVDLLKDEPEYVADVFVGVSILDRSRQLRPEFMDYNATSTLAAYRISVGALDEAKKMLDDALAKTKRQNLGIVMDLSRYYCAKADRENYEKLLNEVIAAEDSKPDLRLSNAIAKRRAKRGLLKAKEEDCGFTTLPAK